MLPRYVFYCLVFLSFAVAVLSGCHTSGKKSPISLFNNEQSMKQMLKGTWILKEYEDSIDAGLTPKLLEYMLTGLYSIKYSSDSDCRFVAGIGKLHITADYDKAWSDEPYSVFLLPSSNNLVFTNKNTKKSDTATLVIDGVDTILQLFKDSVNICFMKYDNSRCPDIDAYDHLINSKFIAGKYYRADDPSKKRHIILTRCGNVEGGQNIDVSMSDFTSYGVICSGFSTNPDVIIFYNAGHNKADMLSWTVSDDSLILTKDDTNNKCIVLVKDL